jgi:hypothetical protein
VERHPAVVGCAVRRDLHGSSRGGWRRSVSRRRMSGGASGGTRGQRASRGAEDARVATRRRTSTRLVVVGVIGARAEKTRDLDRSRVDCAASSTGTRGVGISPFGYDRSRAPVGVRRPVARVRRRRLGTYLRGRVDAHGRVAATASRRGQAFATNGVMTWTAPACLCGLDVHVNERLPTPRKARQHFGIPRATTSAEDLREGLPRRHSPQRRAHSRG